MILNLTPYRPLVKFEYTGRYEIVDDGDENWRLRFLSTGDFTPLEELTVDLFAVGGGAGGWAGLLGTGRGGGGGGYTATTKNVTLTAGAVYRVQVGSGGSRGSVTVSNIPPVGGEKSFFRDDANNDLVLADGGKTGASGVVYSGGSGGSGGALGADSGLRVYYGGTNGSNGSSPDGTSGGSGQGTTTREFGESGGGLYAAGGNAKSGDTGTISMSTLAGSDGWANTGNGGGAGGASFKAGGGSSANRRAGNGGAGGSGIVVMRNARG